MSDSLFTCYQCGGDVRWLTGPGRTEEYWAHCPEVPIPDDFERMTCVKCGETYEDAKSEDALTAVLASGFQSWLATRLAFLCGFMRTRFRITERQVACAMGITPKRLHDITSGAYMASITELRLFEMAVAAPEVFESLFLKPRTEKP